MIFFSLRSRLSPSLLPDYNGLHRSFLLTPSFTVRSVIRINAMVVYLFLKTTMKMADATFVKTAPSSCVLDAEEDKPT